MSDDEYDEDELPTALAYPFYEWDCPECQYDNRVENLGETDECEGCGITVKLEQR